MIPWVRRRLWARTFRRCSMSSMASSLECWRTAIANMCTARCHSSSAGRNNAGQYAAMLRACTSNGTVVRQSATCAMAVL